MAHLSQVFDTTLFGSMLDKMVRRQTHATLPLAIYNYTQFAQYEREWNPVTLACRGLVTRLDRVGAEFNPEREIIAARPWAKFFNLEEHPREALPQSQEPVVVTEKMDGSLGISVPNGEGGFLVATRGSFASEQAQHATQVLHSRYPDFEGREGWTFLWEIIYAQNRIVVDYGDWDDLVLLGAVDIESGASVPVSEAAAYWDGPVVPVHPYSTLSEALAAPNGENREGVVVHFTNSDLRLKIKQADYVALHRIVTNLTTRSVWEVLAEHGEVAPLLDIVPDEYYSWVHETADGFTTQVEALSQETERAFENVMSALAEREVNPDDPTFRREFAMLAKQYSRPGWLFNRLDGKDNTTLWWESLKPPAGEFASRAAASETLGA